MDIMQDLSLFAGGLLAPHTLPSLIEDVGVWESDWSGGASPTLHKPDVGIKSTYDTDEVGNELNIDRTPSAGLLSAFGSNWLETSVDLLDYLTGDDSEVITDNRAAHAVSLLASIAEETSQELSLSPPQSVPPPACSDIKIGQGLPVGTLLDFLSDGIDPCTLGVTAGEISGPYDTLSNISAEDLDDLLSFGPSNSDINTIQTSVPLQPQMQSIKIEADLPHEVVQFLDSVNELSSQSSGYCSSDPDYYPCEATTPVISSTRKRNRRSKPYSKAPKTAASEEEKLSERKLRKKQQNRDAATRYRQKKKSEENIVDTECTDLLERNTELTEKVDHLTKEIRYLKELLAEVFYAKNDM